MKLNILYFASLREDLGMDRETLEVDDAAVSATSDLMKLLSQRGEQWRAVMLDNPNLLVAVNQETATPDTMLSDNDEVACFPPVTGG